MSDLEIGTYTVTITDGNGCVRIEQVVVEEYQLLEIVSLNTFDDCDGTGSLFGDVIGGEAPYTYVWFNSNLDVIATSDSIGNLSDGFYTLRIEDKNGCVTTSSVELEVSPAFEVEVEVTANCEENTFGVVASIEGDENNEGAPLRYYRTSHQFSTNTSCSSQRLLIR